MSIARSLVCVVSFAVAAGGATTFGQQAKPPSIVGVWTINKELSDAPPDQPDERDGRGRGERRGGPSGGGPPGGGGFGGGGRGRGGFGDGRGGPGREEMERRRDALRDIMITPDRLTIVSTESMVIVTAGDGRTTRLATDGSKVKDESTGIERRTHWDHEHLVSEISGTQGGKITETYAVDPDTHRLTITQEISGGRGGAVPARHHVYDIQPE